MILSLKFDNDKTTSRIFVGKIAKIGIIVKKKDEK